MGHCGHACARQLGCSQPGAIGAAAGELTGAAQVAGSD